MLTALEERAADWFESFSDFGPSLRGRLRAHTERFIEAERAREAAWAEATTNDRLTAAFEELSGRGVLACEDLGLAIQDGWGYAGQTASPDQHGVAFFHHEDVFDAVNGLGLFVAFGAIGVETDDEDAAAAALGRDITAALARNGVRCTWSGSSRERIRVEPFDWQKRRWTIAPTFARIEPARVPPERSSWVSKILGRRSSHPPSSAASAEENVPALRCGIVVRALRDENGFDARRARRMREAWKALGNHGPAQVGHVGTPHVFLPARELTSMAPQLASFNLGEERKALFRRGAAAKAARERCADQVG